MADLCGKCTECDDCPSGVWHVEGFGGGGFLFFSGATSYRVYGKCIGDKSSFSITYTCLNFGGGIGESASTVTMLSLSACNTEQAKSSLLGWGWFLNVIPPPPINAPGFGLGVFGSTTSLTGGAAPGYGIEVSGGGSYCWER